MITIIRLGHEVQLEHVFPGQGYGVWGQGVPNPLLAPIHSWQRTVDCIDLGPQRWGARLNIRGFVLDIEFLLLFFFTLIYLLSIVVCDE